MLNLTAKNAHEVAQRVQGHLSGSKVSPLHLLPYNWHDPEGENTWWLTSTGEKVAYAHGKLFCSNSARHCERAQVRCGLHMEKGFEQPEAGTPDQLMKRDWAWHRFVAGVAAGELDEAVHTAAEAVGEPLRLHIVISATDTKEQFLANVTDGSLDDVSIISNPEIRIAGAMKGCKTLSELGAELAGPIRSKAEWYWIDFYLSGLFNLTPTGRDDMDKCVAMLEPFEPFVRAASRGP